MGKKHIEAEPNPISAEIAHLNQLEKLVPGEEDLIRYGLDDEEMADALRLVAVNSETAPHLQLIYTVLRKQRAERPKKPLRIEDLSEFVVLMTDCEANDVNRLLCEMREMGVIKINRRNRVSIKI